ncbi:unnamed protein product [Larinioides sclopetarius]|uniref:Uncharacterized protein n=1 Tax=Larinioides sclopetarius TaxID=280406 RepID=A0AAV2BWH0_9ARAC
MTCCTDKKVEFRSCNRLRYFGTSVCELYEEWSGILSVRKSSIADVNFNENSGRGSGLSHVKNLQIRKDLKKLIEEYKPQKTASTVCHNEDCIERP